MSGYPEITKKIITRTFVILLAFILGITAFGSYHSVASADTGPDLLVQCDHASNLSEELVRGWLEHYMFKKDRDRQAKASRIAKWLADHGHWKSHNRHIPRSVLKRKGLKIEPLEKDQKMQDLVLSVFHATTHTFSVTPAVKIIENHLGKAFIKQVMMPIQMPQRPPAPPPDGPKQASA